MSEARDNNFETLLTTTLKQQKIIEELEADKAELIDVLRSAYIKMKKDFDFNPSWVGELLKKHGVEI